MCSLVLLHTISLQLVVQAIATTSAFHHCLSSSLFSSFLHITSAVIQKPFQRNMGEFKESHESEFRVLKKIAVFWKFQNGIIGLFRIISYFLNNAAKTCFYGLKISGNIEIEHVFQSQAVFHSSSKLYANCLSAFNWIKVDSPVCSAMGLNIVTRNNIVWKYGP